MRDKQVINSLLFRGLKLLKTNFKTKKQYWEFWLENKSSQEFCPKCASPSQSVYDHRDVIVKDEPLRDVAVLLHIKKRRFWCKPCQKPFTEPIKGIQKGYRTTQRYRDFVRKACDRFGDLKQVRKVARCSSNYLYKVLYEGLEHRCARQFAPWPQRIGMDEHFFRKSDYGHRAFVTVFVDLKRRRIKEVVDGKQSSILRANLDNIPGRENVKHIALDLCDSYKSFAKDFFPNAQLVADKFHVLRLLNPSIDKYRKEVTGDRRTLPVRRILLANGKRLDPWVRNELHTWLQKYPILNEVYFYKEALHKLYRIKGYQAAKSALINITDSMANSKIHEIKTLRRTLIKWSSEVLAYFETPITNATTEGFNNKAKVIKRRAYGYRSFKNYRLRLITAC